MTPIMNNNHIIIIMTDIDDPYDVFITEQSQLLGLLTNVSGNFPNWGLDATHVLYDKLLFP